MNKLFDYYKIDDPDKWIKLAVRLAEDCFDGFKVEHKPSKGKRAWWGPAMYDLLYEQYSEYKKKTTDLTDIEICDKLSSREPWKKKNIACKALQNELSKAKIRHNNLLFLKNSLPDMSSLISGISE